MNTLVTILYILICVALVAIVLMQEGKSAGLSGAISGAADSYWGKNKARSLEGKLNTMTKILAVLFMVVSILLNTSWLQ